MPAITLKNIPEDLYDQIKKNAKINYRSLNSEILYILNQSLGHKQIDPVILISKIEKLQAKLSLPKLSDDILFQAKNEGRP